MRFTVDHAGPVMGSSPAFAATHIFARQPAEAMQAQHAKCVLEGTAGDFTTDALAANRLVQFEEPSWTL